MSADNEVGELKVGRPGRPQGRAKGQTAEANELASLLCELTRGFTVRELAERYPAGKTSWSDYRSGAKTVPLHVLKRLVADLVRDSRGRAVLWERARTLHANALAAAGTLPGNCRPPAAPPASPDESTAAPLRFTVLGPLRAWRGEEPISLGSPQQCALLAALLLRGQRGATAAELIDDLWGERPPQAALATLRTYASRLRKSLGAGMMLLNESGGYAVRPARDGREPIDLDRAEGLADKAERLRGAGDFTRARQLIGEALCLWYGEPLAGLPGPYAEAQRVRLAERRLGLLEMRLDLDLALGRHVEAIAELTVLIAAHPLREQFRTLLMLALYRSGRQAEALAVFADARRLFATELGVDPGPELTGMHQRILLADPELAATGDCAPSVAPHRVRPAQLPADAAHFTGRAAALALLRAGLSGADGGATTVSAISGSGGVGKTTLAVHAAQEARERYPDGQLYIDLRGAGPGHLAPHAVLGSFLRALGVADSMVPESTEERAALYRSLLSERRVLVLLDNARDAAQVRPLLPGTRSCAALITSRTRLIDLENVQLVDLAVMSPAEALLLFTGIVGERRAGAEPGAALEVAAACGYLPLALRIAASRLVSRPNWSIAFLAHRLADERRRLAELHAGSLAVEASFDLSYAHLEPPQARAFRLLGLPEGPDISLTAAAALLDLDGEAAEVLLESLVDVSLLESVAPGRYRFHDLVRLYARARAEREEGDGGREAALCRLLDFYLATAAGVYTAERPGDTLAGHLEPTGRAGLSFADNRAAVDWLFREASCLLACVRQQAVGVGLRRAADLLFAAKDLSESGKSHQLYGEVAESVLAAAQASHDIRAEGRVRTQLAYNYCLSGKFDLADEHARQAAGLGEAALDPVTSSHAPNVRGIIAIYVKDWEKAEGCCNAALDAFRADDNLPGTASALSNLARVCMETGRIKRALELVGDALELFWKSGTVWRRANSLYTRGLVLTRADRFDEAVGDLTEALNIFRASRQRRWEGWTHWRIALAHIGARRPSDAVHQAELALGIARELHDIWRESDVLTALGDALALMGQDGRAAACWREAGLVGVRLGRPTAPQGLERR
ncbi:BTAD domain-containing putative transcriptional regulator [Streptomyces sp. NPDC052396]|uniref:AfsR/SARP family transcriptional regulator n=1 Tax=Streptomyces sp. NPDC052396 TaxID=3365689 RepID=UPI0037D269B2